MTETKKKGETKNQHYVPQFYQRNFSNDGKTIGAYVISSNKNISKAPIKNQSSGNYFYSENMEIEHSLGDIEGAAKNVIDKIVANPKATLSIQDGGTLFVFTMMQEGRTLARVNLIQEHTDSILRSVVKKYFEVLRSNGEDPAFEDVTKEELDNCVFSLSQPGVLALGTQAQLIETCADLKYKILINRTALPFITSDNPAAIYDQFMERMGNKIYALGSRGLQIYLPITPEIGILYYDSQCYKLGDRKKEYIEIFHDKDIQELNKLTVANSENVIYYMPSTFTERNIELMVQKCIKFKPTKHIDTFPELKTSEGIILGACNVSIFCHLTLSFVKELPQYKALRPQDYDASKHRMRNAVIYK